MVKNMQIEARQPSAQSMQNQNTTQSRRRSHRTSSALTVLLAVQACSLGTVVSARPGVIARSESGSFQTASISTSAIASSSSFLPPPHPSDEAKMQYRQVDESQEQNSISASPSSYSTASQPSVTALARAIAGELPSVTVSSTDTAMTTDAATTSTQDDGDAPVLLRQADPEPSISPTSTSSVSQENVLATSSPAAVLAVEPTQTQPFSELPKPTGTLSTDDGKEVSAAEGDGNKDTVRARNISHNDDDGDDSAEYHDAESVSSASGDEGSSESCSEEEEGDQNRQEQVETFPLSSTLNQLGNTLPLKRYAALYDAALKARSLSDFAESVQFMDHPKRSWFDDALSTNPGTAAKKANKVQKDDGAMYSVMKRMITSHEKQVDIHKRLVDLLASNGPSKRDHDNSIKTHVRRQDDPSATTTATSSSSSSAETAFPTVSGTASPNEEEERKRDEIQAKPSFKGKTKRDIHGQWDEHEHQCICTSSSTTSAFPSATVSAKVSRKRDDDDDQKRHQLLTSAMSDWSFVSGWLSSRLPVNLHKQVEEALQASSSSSSTTTTTNPDPSK